MGLVDSRSTSCCGRGALRVSEIKEERPRDRAPSRITAGCALARARGRSAGMAIESDRLCGWGGSKVAGPAFVAWRRAALAIDDYRRDHGWHAPDAALGPQPLAPAARRAHERAQRAVEQVREERVRRRGVASRVVRATWQIRTT